MRPRNERAHSAQSPRALRVIVVDDERDSVATLTALLDDEGHEVRGLHARQGSARREWRNSIPTRCCSTSRCPTPAATSSRKQIRQRYGEMKPLLIAMSGRYKKASDKMLAEIVGFDHYLHQALRPEGCCSPYCA